MSTSLHIFKDDLHIAEFELQPGSHLLGIGEDADLLLGEDRVPSDVCYVEVQDETHVVLLALPSVDLRLPSSDPQAEIVLGNGRCAEAAGLTITLLRKPEVSDVQIEAPRTVPVTTKSSLIHAPPTSTLALLLTTTRGTKVIELDRPRLTFGREEGNTARIVHNEVSARHVALVQKASGLWIEDLESTNGSYLNGIPVKDVAFPVGGRLYLSPAPDAPVIELLTRSAALGRTAASGALLGLVGSSAVMETFRDQLLRYGGVDQPVLITGETGTGKEVTAQALANVRGPGKPFIAFNCAELRPELAGSEIFGHAKGAFTGAIRDHRGFFETAEDGTVFLDELGELTLDLQALLLRALENRTIRRRGESREREIRCRFIAATNRDLPTMMKTGAFRPDLFQRLSPLQLCAPPLRDRLSDLLELVPALLGKIRGDGEGKFLSSAAMAKLGDYDWPGNVRELANVLQRAAIHTRGMEIPAEAIVFASGQSNPKSEVMAAAATIANEAERRRFVERALCEQALKAANNNVRRAARSMGKSHTSFRRRLMQLDILPPPTAAGDGDQE